MFHECMICYYVLDVEAISPIAWRFRNKLSVSVSVSVIRVRDQMR